MRGRGGRSALLYVHVEHQRTVHPLMALRTVEYQTRIVRAWLRARRSRSRRLPLVVSVVVYNGDDPWSAETAYERLVHPGMSAAAGPFQLRASYVLVDLPAIREELLAALRHPHLVLGLLLLRASSRRAGRGGWEVLARWARLIGEVALLPGGSERVDGLFAYAGGVFGAPAPEVYDEIVAGATPEGRTVMQTWQEVLRKKGLEQGLEQGLERGLEQGREQGVLIGEILTWAQIRFGPVPADVAARVNAGSGADLRRWRAAVESVERLDDLFAAPGAAE